MAKPQHISEIIPTVMARIRIDLTKAEEYQEPPTPDYCPCGRELNQHGVCTNPSCEA